MLAALHLALLGATVEINTAGNAPGSIQMSDASNQYLASIEHGSSRNLTIKTAATPGGTAETRLEIDASTGNVVCTGQLTGADVIVNGVSFNALVQRVVELEAIMTPPPPYLPSPPSPPAPPSPPPATFWDKVALYTAAPNSFECGAGSCGNCAGCGNWPNRIWEDQCTCASPGSCSKGLFSNASPPSNGEGEHWILMVMSEAVSASSFEGKTRCDNSAADYFGNAKLYGCNGNYGSSATTIRSSCSWVELAHLTATTNAAGTVVGPATITDTTAYSYYQMTMYGNGRQGHQSASYLRVTLR